MSRDAEPLVVQVAFRPLWESVDVERVRAISPGADVEYLDYHLSLGQQVERERAQGAPCEEVLTDEQRAVFARGNVLVTMYAPLDLGALAPGLRWVQALGSGVGHLVPSRLTEAGVVVTNGAGTNAPEIGEWVLARVLEDLKRLPEHAEHQRQNRWRMTLGRSLTRSTIAVVGLGAIGREVAWRFRALGATVVGVRRSWQPGMVDDAVDQLLGPEQLDDALALADVVVLAVPGSTANENLFDAERFAAMQQGAMFLNVGRGTTVDEDALSAALQSGHLRSAALDVTRTEPLPADSPLWDQPNLRISPHSSTDGEAMFERAVELVFDNLQRFVDERPLRNVVDLSTYLTAAP